MPGKVMICVDESQWAERAFNYYIKELHQEGNEVLLAHISEPIFDPSSGFKAGLVITPEQWEAMVAGAAKRREAMKSKFGGELDRLKITYHFVSEEGKDVGHHLCDIAKREHISMCVLGTRGMGSLRRTFLGSTSDYVLHHLHCPVAICSH